MLKASSGGFRGAWLVVLSGCLSAAGCGFGEDSHDVTAETSAPGRKPSLRQVSEHPLLTVSPRGVIDFGLVEPGSRRERTIWLTNPTDVVVEIGTIDNSCPCLEVLLPARVILPGEKIGARVELDLGSEREFAGELRLRVTGLTTSGRLAFALQSHVKVSSKTGG